ncbi:synaptojanin-1-like [Artemia franciscana]|uniref:synaptojanin-1-like n=1 Tax=Artemia franciscana TaxID=6661 RepID=UPI0032DA50F3
MPAKPFVLHIKPNEECIIERIGHPYCLCLDSNGIYGIDLEKAQKTINKHKYTFMLEVFACLGLLRLQMERGDSHLFLVVAKGVSRVGGIQKREIFRIEEVEMVSFQPLASNSELLKRKKRVTDFLSNGAFYFAFLDNGETCDITLSSERYFKGEATDSRFFWNKSFFSSFIEWGIEPNDWLVKIICGSVEVQPIPWMNRTIKAALISRLSCERVGARFNTRGINDDGQVANFVETEQIIQVGEDLTSFVQIRGSVPTFWEQTFVPMIGSKIRFLRSIEASLPAFERHFRTMTQLYGNIFVLNLLCKRFRLMTRGEQKLSEAYKKLYQQSNLKLNVHYQEFDYHNMGTIYLNKLIEDLKNIAIKQFNFFHYSEGVSSMSQKGVIRTNCLDCYDRTNEVQALLGIKAFDLQLKLCMKGILIKTNKSIIYDMWTRNGNEIPRIFTRAGALKHYSISDIQTRIIRTYCSIGNYETKLQGKLNDILESNTTNIHLREKARSLLSNSWAQMPEELVHSICAKGPQFTCPVPIRIAVGTYNVMGSYHMDTFGSKNINLADWLLGGMKDRGEISSAYNVQNNKDVDMFVIGLQELIPSEYLSIIYRDQSYYYKAWMRHIKTTLQRNGDYKLLTSVTMGGLLLCVFVRPKLFKHIRNVETDTKTVGIFRKVNIKKGAVQIRFDLYSTSFAFVSCHLPAHADQAYERNKSFEEIVNKLSSEFTRDLHSHDYVIWLGDMNYRINTSREVAEQIIREKGWKELLKHDQLKKYQSKGFIFQDYTEAEINFPPTYKYEVGTGHFDTSKKQRVPSWTDRILIKTESSLVPLFYGVSPLEYSDHRPVLGIYDVTAFKVDENTRHMITASTAKNVRTS